MEKLKFDKNYSKIIVFEENPTEHRKPIKILKLTLFHRPMSPVCSHPYSSKTSAVFTGSL